MIRHKVSYIAGIGAAENADNAAFEVCVRNHMLTGPIANILFSSQSYLFLCAFVCVQVEMMPVNGNKCNLLSVRECSNVVVTFVMLSRYQRPVWFVRSLTFFKC